MVLLRNLARHRVGEPFSPLHRAGVGIARGYTEAFRGGQESCARKARTRQRADSPKGANSVGRQQFEKGGVHRQTRSHNRLWRIDTFHFASFITSDLSVDRVSHPFKGGGLHPIPSLIPICHRDETNYELAVEAKLPPHEPALGARTALSAQTCSSPLADKAVRAPVQWFNTLTQAFGEISPREARENFCQLFRSMLCQSRQTLVCSVHGFGAFSLGARSSGTGGGFCFCGFSSVKSSLSVWRGRKGNISGFGM